jgi:hypothetical protein
MKSRAMSVAGRQQSERVDRLVNARMVVLRDQPEEPGTRFATC